VGNPGTRVLARDSGGKTVSGSLFQRGVYVRDYGSKWLNCQVKKIKGGGVLTNENFECILAFESHRGNYILTPTRSTRFFPAPDKAPVPPAGAFFMSPL
jgi:hypothetical protein